MKKSKQDYLVVINTPFQYLCALEYLYKHEIDKDRCDLILISPLEITLNQIKQINPVEDFNNFLAPLTNLSNFLIPYFKTYIILRKQNPQNLIIGNLSNPWSRYLIKNFSFNNRPIILDDGAGSIPILRNRGIYDFSLPLSSKLNRVNIFYKIFLKLKSEINQKLHFFTFFDLYSIKEYDTIDINNFNLLLSKYSNKKFEVSQELWVIGSPFVELNMINNKDYKFILNKIEKYSKFNNLKMIYFPHRIENEMFKCEFETVKNNMPFELYYLNSFKKPKIILSFYSSSLLVLSKLRIKSKLISINLSKEIRVNPNNPVWKNVEKVYDYIKIKNNIKNIDIDNFL